MRSVYEDVLATRPGFPDVLMFNQHNELTESTIASLVLSLNGGLFTPPIACGLLPGTLRAHLLAEGRLQERTLTVDDVRAADGLFLVNSVRGFHPVTLHYNSVLAATGLCVPLRQIAQICPSKRTYSDLRHGTNTAMHPQHGPVCGEGDAH